MKSTITGWGKCSPDNIMTNDDLAVFVDTSDEWIQQRTGIQERRFCHVNNSDMASVAGQHAIACAGLTPEDIDVVILATCTPDSIVPSAAAHVQRKIGAVNASVYDVNAACAGCVYAMEQGKAVAFAIFNLQARGEMFVTHNDPVYPGMIVGLSPKPGDMIINVMKGKKLTNMRASGSDVNIILTPAKKMSLEQILSFLNEDELAEITPKNIRLRKKILNENDRKRYLKSSNQVAAPV